MLSQAATLTVPWLPDKGDLIVHDLTILRGNQVIDLLAKGQKFIVLRREQALEQRQLTGVLTATLAVEGLQVGDILRVRLSTTAKDLALAGRTQSVFPIIVAPARVGFAQMRLLWPKATTVSWKLLAEGTVVKPVTKGAYTELVVPLPVPKQPEIPDDAPQRFRSLPLIETSTFAGWADVSIVMAPLYKTDGTIAPGGPIATEVAAIVKADATPLGRAARALQLVQDKIRYLAVGMDGGNYIPQKPEQTWALRYGDCKAKTLLLLAILRSMNIEAEPVLAHIGLGGAVPRRVQSVAAFNHVLVSATINGERLWLDGTGSGSRLADIRDTPPLGFVLPVRPGGADISPVTTRPNARPTIDLSVDVDESASLDLPSVFSATAVVRGSSAAALSVAKAQLGEKEQRDAVGQFFQQYFGGAQFSSASIATDAAEGSVTLSARGTSTTIWTTEEHKRKRSVTRAVDTINFEPDRARASWSAIPVATENPNGVRYHMKLRLPEGGQGYTVQGEPNFQGRLGGYVMSRSMDVSNGVVTVDERIDATGEEIAAAAIPAERDKVSSARTRMPRIVAPESPRRRWDLAGRDPAGATQVAAIDAIFGRAIANDPSEESGYTSRSSFRNGIGDRRGALADLDKAITLAPSISLYLARSSINYDGGDLAAALADAEAARKLDPSSSDAVSRVVWQRAEHDDIAGAMALVDERISIGGDANDTYRELKAEVLGEFGDASESLKLWDGLNAARPGSPDLLNGRCWTKAIRSLMLDSALKDCTASIELSSDPGPALDSRAMVYFRLGRYDEALRDIDAALVTKPGQGPTHYLRGAVLSRLHRDAEAGRERVIARAIEPSVDRTYKRYRISY